MYLIRTETRSYHDGVIITSHDVDFDGNDIYLDIVQSILKKESEDLYIELGENSYPFKFMLPFDLPGSLEHKFGHIRFEINATINIPK